MHLAASRGHQGLAEYLLARRAEAIASEDGSQQPLHFAAAGGHLPMTELLVALGAGARSEDAAVAFEAGHDLLAGYLRTLVLTAAGQEL